MDLPDSPGEHEVELPLGPAVSREEDLLRCTPRAQRLMKLSSRGDFEAAPLTQEKPEKGAIRVGLDGVADGKLRWQGAPQQRPFPLEHGGVIDKQGRPVFRGDAPDRDAANSELASGRTEVLGDERHSVRRSEEHKSGLQSRVDV